MTAIQDVLEELNRIGGVRGSALVTADGIMVASALRDKSADDVVAGLASFLIATTRRTLEESQLGRFSRFVLTATHGKLVLLDLGDSFLVVLTDQFARLDQCLQEVQEAARQIRRLAQIA
jgi:predicted regulator of Ras-like GTPase activity (Roadblock/LC7/MglB family)